jgi:molecular chaperone Hsp33
MSDGAASPADDLVLPFEVKPLGVRGRIVRLGAAVNDILHRHAYPAPVSALLGEAVALTAMLGTAMKFDGKFILQTKTDGPVDMIVTDYLAPGGLRGYARFDAGRLAILAAPGPATLLGKGHLAMTVDQGPDMDRYQGIVALEGTDDLTAAAHGYFTRSEQIPTSLRLAAGPLLERGGRSEFWRAAAIMVQHLPRQGGMGTHPDAEAVQSREPDDWVKARLLLETVEDHELLDPTLAPERLLYRLFHEDGVTVYPPVALSRHCSCSPQAIRTMLERFPADDRAEMVMHGQIEVTCEFCSSTYRFTPDLAPVVPGN